MNGTTPITLPAGSAGDVDRAAIGVQLAARLLTLIAPGTCLVEVSVAPDLGEVRVHFMALTDAQALAGWLGLAADERIDCRDMTHHNWRGRVDGVPVRVLALTYNDDPEVTR